MILLLMDAKIAFNKVELLFFIFFVNQKEPLNVLTESHFRSEGVLHSFVIGLRPNVLVTDS